MIVLQAATARAWIPIEKFAVIVMEGRAFSHPQFYCTCFSPRFELVVNGKQVSAKAQGTATSATPKAPNPFAVFVKENYKNHKAPGVKHGDVMKILSVKFSETKINK